jgi:uncharacterized membrane protein (TIGR02234 family)
MAERRSRSFGPTVLVGLAGATVAAVAAARDWATASGSAAGVDVTAAVRGSATAPLGIALALVALAAWGVVLVLRGRVRRFVAILGALASAGVVAAVAAGFQRAQDDAVNAVVAKGGTGDAVPSSLTGWYYACGVGAVLALAAFAVAVVAAPGWPAMGSRYDAPGARSPRAPAATADGRPVEPATERDMWRALDDGRDPTA